MDKKLYDLKIDPELHDLIPPPSENERQMLEDSIVRDGCDTPLVVWNGIIVDGHNRYEICHKHNIPFAIDEKDFEDKGAAILWMLERQLARRNLLPYLRVKLAERYEPLFKEYAQKRILAGRAIDPPQNSAEGLHKGETRDAVAKLAGVSHDTVSKIKKIDALADESIKDELRKGSMSVHKAYTTVLNKEHEGETRKCQSCGKEKPFSDFSIPSNRLSSSTICKTCEAEAKRLAAEEKARESNPSITGIDRKDGQVAHVLVGLPDSPEAFNQVVSMLQSAQSYYIAAFNSLLDQYKVSMITKANTDQLMSMINDTNDTIITMLKNHIKEAN